MKVSSFNKERGDKNTWDFSDIDPSLKSMTVHSVNILNRAWPIFRLAPTICSPQARILSGRASSASRTNKR